LHAQVVNPRVVFEHVAFEPQSELVLQAFGSFIKSYKARRIKSKILPKHKGGIPMNPGLQAQVVYPRVVFEHVALEPQSELVLQAFGSIIN
jgi:hypothetical protein